MSSIEKKHIIEAFHFELGKVNTMEIRKRMVDYLTHIDLTLAQKVAEGIGVETPDKVNKIQGVDYEALEKLREEWKDRKTVDRSPALSMENYPQKDIRSRKIAIMIDNGYDHDELEQITGFLKDEGAAYEIISKTHGNKKSADGRETMTDKSQVTTADVLYDGLYIPGGEHIARLKEQGDVLHFINETYKHCKPIAVCNEATQLLKMSQIPGLKIADKSEDLVNDKGVVSQQGSKDLSRFREEFKNAIKAHRHWIRENKDQVPA